MSLFDDIFYDLASDIVDMFVDVETKFYITKISSRPFARPEEVTAYQIPQEFNIKCTPPYKNKNTEDTGGVSRDDLTSKRHEKMTIFIPEKNIPAGAEFDPNQHVRIEMDYEGRRVLLINYQPIKADGKVGRIFEFEA
jgi:hypothetical protein